MSDISIWSDNSVAGWVNNDLSAWGYGDTAFLNQIFIDDLYVYAATSTGLDIIDIFTNNKVSYINYSSGFFTVWGNSDCIYLGTSDDGIKYIEKTTISGNSDEPFDLDIYLLDYDFMYNTSSNYIKYIHGSETTLAVVTSSGIDIFNNDNRNGYKSTFSNEFITKCFMTSKKELYYVIKGTSNDSIDILNYCLCDWQNPDVSYVIGQSFLPLGVSVNDIFVTEKTSENKINNTLFVATTNGAYVLDEGTTDYDTYYIKQE